MNKPEMIKQGFNRVERDDGLLDIFTKETPEKGVELWGKGRDDTLEIIRIHNGNQTHKKFPRQEIEQALLENQKLILE